MKILLMTTHLDFGGISSYTVSLAKKLRERGHQVWVASSGGRLEEVLKNHSIPHIKVNVKTKSELNPKVILAIFKLLRFIRQEGIELIHVQTRVTQVVAFYLSKLTKIPYISTCHGFFKPRLSRKIFKFWGDKVIAISDAVRVHLVNDLRVTKDKIELIYNGIDLEEFLKSYTNEQKDEYRREVNLKGGPVVGIIARLSEVKGHKYLLKAAKEILEVRPDVQFLIIGEGPEKKNLLKLVDELKIKDNVHFAQSVIETTLPLSIMDVFVMPSLQEGLGLSILEAMAKGLPVVASDVGGIYSLVEDGKSGYLIKPRQDLELKEAILRLLKDKRMAEAFGRYGQKKVKSDFSLDDLIKKVENVYQRVLKGY